MRVKTGFTRRRRHKAIKKLAAGYRMSRHRLHRSASDAVLHAGEYAFAGRKNRKRDFRRLWITRINGGLTESGLSYSRFIAALKKAQISLDRKILANLVASDPVTFKSIVEKAKSSL
ncbi:MAG: 50S ribosomal protein L20 [bacterium]|nr:50S ribosomal protein L20 [bacterium]